MLRKQISLLPAWLFTALTVGLILWLTLSPDPLDDEDIPLFPGADKIAHAIMFGFLTVMILLDRQRKREWRRLTKRFILGAAATSTFLGIAVEFAQLLMRMGRSFETADMLADAVGAFFCAWLFRRLQHFWSVPSD